MGTSACKDPHLDVKEAQVGSFSRQHCLASPFLASENSQVVGENDMNLLNSLPPDASSASLCLPSQVFKRFLLHFSIHPIHI
ncbi:hypothetical protein MRB53_023451 [Persea americana]|uniref:Uncharacterized protein n=1 Tax=Persea americana TaxID=3435 RepID=A0ACC2L9Z8_PERAE|nr:hypothetical protein MRB53_023451 [Persea americana]